MDSISIIGLLLGLGAIIGGQILEGGHLGSLLQPTAAMIVLGGTFGAVLLYWLLSRGEPEGWTGEQIVAPGAAPMI